MLDSYVRLTEGGKGEIVEKKSRFIAYVEAVTTEAEAYAFIEKIKKKNYDARHNCYAFSVGEEMPLLRFSDDGEPQGTAGKPILEVINGSGIRNICIVVTRYFGGTLLGTGGLVRAYTDASKEGLKNCKIKKVQRIVPAILYTNYTDMGKIQYILGLSGINITSSCFEERVTFNVELPINDKERVVADIVEATGGRTRFEFFEETFA